MLYVSTNLYIDEVTCKTLIATALVDDVIALTLSISKDTGHKCTGGNVVPSIK